MSNIYPVNPRDFTHSMNSVSQQCHFSIVPRTRRSSVIQITLLHLVLLGDSKNVMDFVGPALEHILQVQASAAIWFFDLRVGLHGQESVPLVPAITDVRDHEVLLGSDVDLVSHGSIVRSLVIQLSSLPKSVR